MLAIWGTTIARNGLTASVIKTPDMEVKGMTPSGYQVDVTTTVDILRTEYVRLKLAVRAQFQCEGVNYECLSASDDSAEPTIQMRAVKTK